MNNTEAHQRITSYVPWHQAEEPRSYDLSLCHDDWRAWIDEAADHLDRQGLLRRCGDVVKVMAEK